MIIKKQVEEFLDQERKIGVNEVQDFFQSRCFQSSLKLNELIEAVENLEKENEDKIDNIMQIASDTDHYIIQPLDQIKETARNFENDAYEFQNAQAQFNNSFKMMSEELMPTVVINQNLDLAIGLYTKLKSALSLFCRPITADMLTSPNTQDDYLDQILSLNDYFNNSSNSSAVEIFKFRLNQWESEIAQFIKNNIQALSNSLDIFFNKINQSQYKYNKEIKASILIKIFPEATQFIEGYKSKSTDESKDTYEFNGDIAINRYPNFIKDFFNAYQKVSSIKVQCFSESIDQLFFDIFSKFIGSINKRLENVKSTDKISFKYRAFYHKISEEISSSITINVAKFDVLFQSIREKCVAEIIEQLRQDINISDIFIKYINDPTYICKNTSQSKNDNKSEIPDSRVFNLYLGQLIIDEVLSTIFKFEKIYKTELSALKETNNPTFINFLIEISNSFVQNLNSINVLDLTVKRRTTCIIIMNSYYALYSLVKQYTQDIISEPSLNSYNYRDNCLKSFASSRFCDLKKVQGFFEHVKNIVDDSLKLNFTTLFLQYLISLIIKNIAEKPNKSKRISDNSTLLNKFHNLAKEMWTQIKDKKKNEQVFIVKNNTFLPKIENLCDKTIAFLQDPQKSTMDSLTSLFSDYIIPNFHHNLRVIINGKE